MSDDKKKPASSIAGISAVITFFATKVSNTVGSSYAAILATSNGTLPFVFVPGWMTTTPLNDTDCQFRRSEISRMRDAISLCADPLARNMESIGHRGVALVGPEETIKSFQIAVDSGAAFIECDVAVTKELDLECRHGVCDLHFTTDILQHPELATKCSKPFTPASNGTKASESCCTYNFTVDEMMQLCATIESQVNGDATWAEDYASGQPPFCLISVAKGKYPKMVTMKEYLTFARSKSVNVIPELKDTTENVTQVFLATKNATIAMLAHKFVQYLKDANFTAPFDKNLKDEGKKGNLSIMPTFDRHVAKIWKQNSKALPVLYLLETPMNSTTTEKC